MMGEERYMGMTSIMTWMVISLAVVFCVIYLVLKKMEPADARRRRY